MQVQKINLTNTNYSNQSFKARVVHSKALDVLKERLDFDELKMLNTYIDLINKSPSDVYYRYEIINGPVIYSEKIGQKFPIEFPNRLEDALELFRMVAGKEVWHSETHYTSKERELVTSKFNFG